MGIKERKKEMLEGEKCRETTIERREREGSDGPGWDGYETCDGT